MRLSLLLSFLLIFIIPLNLQADSPTIIKLGFIYQKRNLKFLPSMNQDSYKLGIDLALEQFNNSPFAKRNKLQVEVITYAANNKTTSLQNAYEKAIKDGVVAIMGLPTSQEALSVGQLAVKHKTLTFSFLAANTNIEKYRNYLFSGALNSNDDTELTQKHILKHEKLNRVLFITRNNSLFTSGFINKLIINSKNKLEAYDLIKLDPLKQLSKEQLKKLKKSSYDLVALSLYAYQGVNVLNQLAEHGIVKQQPVIVSGAWYYDFKPIDLYLKQHSNIYVITSMSMQWIHNNAGRFILTFKKEFHQEPDTNHVIAYDVSNMIVTAIKKSKDYTRKSILKSFTDHKHFTGISGPYHYDNCRSHPRKYYFIHKLNKNKVFQIESKGLLAKDEDCY